MDNEDALFRETIFEIIEKQVQQHEPPAIEETLKRLMGDGYEMVEAMALIGSVLAGEMFAILKEDREHDEKQYIDHLKALPQLPWDEDADDQDQNEKYRQMYL